MSQVTQIRGYPGYLIDNQGNVWSLKRHKFLRRNIICGCRPTVELFAPDGKSKRIQISRLVAEHFIPNPEGLPEVNHKDECPLNNTVQNLEWCTHDYNMKYGTRTERAIKKNS